MSDGSIGAHVGGNKLGRTTPKLITFDDGTVAAGYLGPKPDEGKTLAVPAPGIPGAGTASEQEVPLRHRQLRRRRRLHDLAVDAHA